MTDQSQASESTHSEEERAAERRLRRVAGPVLLWGLGVGSVISGEFFGWNFGLNAGGWGGLLIATAIMATLYSTMMMSIAEMSTAMPVAGGPYAFARRAMGKTGGYVTGLAVVMEYVLAPAVIAVGIGGYVADFLPLPPFLVALVAYAIFIGINLLGVKESLQTLLVITVISVIVLIVWGLAMAPNFSVDNLLNIPPDDGNSRFLPFGFFGILAALPAAGWFYLAIEDVPLAAEETADPANDLPKGMLLAMGSLVAFSMISLFIGPGSAGSEALATSGNPLPQAADDVYGRNWIYWLTTVVGLTGLIASFFSIIYAYSRQIFSLSRAGYLPTWLSRTNDRKAPHWALIVPGIIGFATIQVIDFFNTMGVPEGEEPEIATGDLLIQIAVFAALISYVMMMVSHFILRSTEPDMERPYRTPGAPVTPAIALVLSVLAMFSTVFYAPQAAFMVGGVIMFYLLGLAYYWFYSRHHLVADAPEEEFALISEAEEEVE
ncbi:MAG: ethanolamine permease [Actinobacteria bacterium]|nr:ethanolamine permease [Actinomycetota bacterium]